MIPGNAGGWKKLLASWAVATLAELELHRAHHAGGRVHCFSKGATVEAAEKVAAGAPLADMLDSYGQLTPEVLCAAGGACQAEDIDALARYRRLTPAHVRAADGYQPLQPRLVLAPAPSARHPPPTNIA
jgi:hypothetical protein